MVVSIYMYIYIHIHLHIYIYIYTYIHIHISPHTTPSLSSRFYLALTEKAEEFKSGCVVRGSVLQGAQAKGLGVRDKGLGIGV